MPLVSDAVHDKRCRSAILMLYFLKKYWKHILSFVIGAIIITTIVALVNQLSGPIEIETISGLTTEREYQTTIKGHTNDVVPGKPNKPQAIVYIITYTLNLITQDII